MEYERDLEFVGHRYGWKHADDARISGHGGRNDHGDRICTSGKFCGLRRLCDGDNAATRTGTYQISGAGITTTSVNLKDVAGTDFNGTFTQASNSNGNYVQDHGSRVHDYGDAGSGNGRESAGTSECHPDRAAVRQFRRIRAERFG
jgi:hypothetical protein